MDKDNRPDLFLKPEMTIPNVGLIDHSELLMQVVRQAEEFRHQLVVAGGFRIDTAHDIAAHYVKTIIDNLARSPFTVKVGTTPPK